MSENKNNPLAGRDYVIAIDRSMSMSNIVSGTKTRFQWAQEQTEGIARVAHALDPDGIDVYFFNNKVVALKNVTPDKVTQIFKENQPSGGTATDLLIKEVGDDYFKRKAAGNAKPVTLVIVTDGEPNDQVMAEKAIVDIANKIDKDEEFAILFTQVGNDQGCRAWLKKLDDELVSKNNAKFDIVDTKNDDEMADMTVEDLLLDAIND